MQSQNVEKGSEWGNSDKRNLDRKSQKKCPDPEEQKQCVIFAFKRHNMKQKKNNVTKTETI